jgi:hypothetical protein
MAQQEEALTWRLRAETTETQMTDHRTKGKTAGAHHAKRWLNMTGDDKKTAVYCITRICVLNERTCHGETDEIRTRCSNDRGLC